MSGGQDFVDYYRVLQVSPTCDAKSLELAYHRMAKAHHPDHAGGTDHSKFNDVTEAYRVLRDAKRRSDYDAQFRVQLASEWPEPAADEIGVNESSALSDADDHVKILMYLYKSRRDNAQNAGVVGYYLQQMLQCSDEHFDFHKWYLKEKGYVEVTEHGTLAITIHGIDHVISMSRSKTAEKLLISQSVADTDCSVDENPANGRFNGHGP
jgi:curved DNA-binding protein